MRISDWSSDVCSSDLDKAVALVSTLARPDDGFLRLVFVADAARALGARDVTLIAPYLAYMRQDRRFRPGEAVTSRTFAGLISSSFDRLVTVDPHLQRYQALDQLYAIPRSQERRGGEGGVSTVRTRGTPSA